MIRATVAEPSGHLATLERSCYGAGNYTLMQSISDTIVYCQPKVAAVCSAPSGAKLDVVVASVGTDPKWLAGKRPEKFNHWLSLRTPEGRNIPTPGTNGHAVIG